MFNWKRIYTPIIDTVQTILLAASVFIVIYLFLFRPFQVSGESMYPTFKDKQYILTSIVSLEMGPPKRGDVVVFHAPVDAEKDFIKRVIGLPGERVMVKDGYVYINGSKLDESKYLKPDVMTYEGATLHEGVEMAIPQGYYAVFGDNRRNSSDSREWGFVKRSALIGKSFFVYWPPQSAELVKNPYTSR